jgi:GxxExxY protein
MPIHCTIPILPINQEEFVRLDYQIMSHAFDCQNEIGSLADERVYKMDLSCRLRNAGFTVDLECEIVLSHQSFLKSLFLDLVVNGTAIYELKSAIALTEAHRAQLLTYLYITNSDRGKLINFATPNVKAEFVNAVISRTNRRTFSIDRSKYSGTDALIELVTELVHDWGTSLSPSLYLEAITFILGGSDSVDMMLPMNRAGQSIGSQRFHLCAPNTAFRITTITKSIPTFGAQLQRLISCSQLTQLHWINIRHHDIQFITFRN